MPRRTGRDWQRQASRETERFYLDAQKTVPERDGAESDRQRSGASVYSASELAAQEFPDLDVPSRGAVLSRVVRRIRWRNW
ncbi:hypothetical protein PQQ12_01860 [Salmonella enterica subsp. enterica serovar Dublin]|nr:hypothetical protein [Salmonella enterica]WDX23488.1 hypothetical protein PQQ12_01860 [Salmonella enterica subsp. enterica serovar Dublin]